MNHSDIRDEYMYEVRGGASFRKGSCGGTRISSSEMVTLILPPYSATIGDIRILAGELQFESFLFQGRI